MIPELRHILSELELYVYVIEKFKTICFSQMIAENSNYYACFIL
ncbi:hypothetical protein PSFL107428_13685 [Pseudoalteromonas maricaloris]